ncbi:PREDICTED: uncharacterized protein C20orf195 homolog [Nanorana parkeri]|uniref:uncharacterized protein C20orf195 homolog n=1 Tax=Nanorana parkeri TaxID=125878 RepID=UPI0008541CE2|nr:PREDICTED: uncharacterized protein C20orf195 homolog [Nanorana parkeri]
MAQATSKSDLSAATTSVKIQLDEGELTAGFSFKEAIAEFLNKNLNKDALKSFEARVEILRKSSFFITIQPKKILLSQQNTMHYVNIFQVVDPQRFQRMKTIGTNQTKIQLFILQEYLEQLKNCQRELVELVQSKNGEFSLAIQKDPVQYLSELSELLNNFKNMLTPGPLHLKHQLIPHVPVRQIPPLRLILKTKGPVTFDRKVATAFDNWAFLSWHVCGQRHLTDSYELCFQQLNVPSNEVAHSGIHIISSNTFKIYNLLPEKLYEFSIRRTEAFNLVYDEWRDVITLSTGENSACNLAKSQAFGDYQF